MLKNFRHNAPAKRVNIVASLTGFCILLPELLESMPADISPNVIEWVKWVGVVIVIAGQTFNVFGPAADPFKVQKIKNRYVNKFP